MLHALVLAPVALVASAAEDSLTTLRQELVGTFEELASFCQKKKLYLQRDAMYELVLEVDPDHAVARKTLGYKKKGERWERGKYREPKDRGKDEDAAELARLRTYHAGAYAERLTPLFEDMATPERLEEIAPYLLLDPEHADLNLLIGRVMDGQGRWRDPEELAAERRRGEIQDLVWQAFQRQPELTKWELGPPASTVDLSWTEHLGSDSIRVAGTGGAAEVRRAAEVAHALDAFLLELLPPAAPETWGKRAKVRARSTHKHPRFRKFDVFLLDRRAEAPALLDGWPELGAEARELYPQLSTAYLDTENTLGVWVDDKTERLDAMTRQLVGAYLRDHFGLSVKNGWVWEGFGIYVTHLLVGTRMTFFVNSGDYVDDADANLDVRLLRPEADWLEELQSEVEGGRKPRLGFVIGKEVNSMEIRDLLVSNALAVYLTEEHPEVLTPMLSDLGEGMAELQALEKALGKKLPTIEADLYAWLEKRTR